MFDATPLTPEEITDQCRALTYAVIELENPAAKEALLFVLAERLEVLLATLEMPDDGDSDTPESPAQSGTMH
ncbi:hypothetical protein KSI86_16390 [Dickeya oryzae]|uniref:hypothetical protein n=1 Tax=Dickeya oryzae TaxID=1240404 RepID=UPI0020976A2A|nr:hypothetical protein [Dickeya oryzae]MCO7255739.1 hypothetical protein [Dickeya oryzae]